ncbi:MAG: hypothetical protein MUO39_15320 [Steroidobacteraceae bacterium]|nr:hypothetical protein [Steroidobacteraceae bacterium]
MKIDRWRALAALVLSIASGAGSAAAEKSVPGTEYLRITAVAPGYTGRDPSDNRWFVYLEGYIDNGATARLEHMLGEQQIRSAVVFFDSPGGHVVEAMALGRAIRKRGFATSVGARVTNAEAPRAGRCYSACPIAYAGGALRSLGPGTVLAIHRAENIVPVPDETAFQKAVTGQVKDYLIQMGISIELLAIMSNVPHRAIRELAPDEAVRLGLVNAGGLQPQP